MTYDEYKQQRQDAFNSLPIFFAFSKEQFKEAMESRGLTVDDTDKLYSFPGGGFYLRSDADIVRAFFNKPDPIKELMNDEGFAESAFYYEMANHEYHINWQGDWDVCSCFGNCEYDEEKTYVDYLKEEGYSDKTILAYHRARKKFLKYCNDNDMY